MIVPTGEELIVLIRTFSIFVPIVLASLTLSLCPPKGREFAGISVSFLWVFCSLSLLNPLAQYFGFWTFSAEGALLFGTPVDLLIGWALLWSVVTIGLLRAIPWWATVLLLGLFDLIFMPLCEPVLVLHNGWFYVDLIFIFAVVLPSNWIYEITCESKYLTHRNLFQAAIYTMIFIVILPLIILEKGALGDWVFENVFLVLQLFFSVLFFGLSALFEFNSRGKGTPFPMDKTQRLVTTGAYAFVRNPMQITTISYFVVWFFVSLNPWFLAAAAMTLIYCVGYANWQEGADMELRFDDEWIDYKAEVRSFFPVWKPYRKVSASVYLDLDECGLCADLGRWILRLDAKNLELKNAKFYPGEMSRMKYIDADGFEENGIRALGRVLEHTNLLLSFFSFFVRLPIIGEVGQFFLDFLAPPHTVCRADIASSPRVSIQAEGE